MESPPTAPAFRMEGPPLHHLAGDSKQKRRSVALATSHLTSLLRVRSGVRGCGDDPPRQRACPAAEPCLLGATLAGALHTRSCAPARLRCCGRGCLPVRYHFAYPFLGRPRPPLRASARVSGGWRGATSAAACFFPLLFLLSGNPSFGSCGHPQGGWQGPAPARRREGTLASVWRRRRVVVVAVSAVVVPLRCGPPPLPVLAPPRS